MNPSNLETIILLLLFFLPGYLYFSLKAKFKYQSWTNKEIIFLSFLFCSIIFQFLAWLILGVFKRDVLVILKNGDSLNNLLTNNLSLIGLQVTTAMALAFATAIVSSTKQLKRFTLWIQRKTSLNKFLELGLEYTPTIPGALEHETDFGKKAVGCVIQMKNGVFYDGNIRHIGHGKNGEDYIIVLSRVTKLSKGVKTKLPDEMKVLIPYDNIESIAYKEYPLTENINNKYFVVLSSLNIFLSLILVLLLLLSTLQNQGGNPDFLKLITELYGAFVVTFLGVYISIRYTKKSDQEKEKNEREKIYLGGLKLLASELSLNEQPLIPLSEALDSIPDEPDKYYDNYGFLLEMVRDVKTDVFYGLVSSGTMGEICKSESIFNKIQQAYYNVQKTINGISLSREVFKDFANISIDKISPDWIDMAKGIISNESKKLKRTITMVQDARKEIERELLEYGITFSENSGENIE